MLKTEFDFEFELEPTVSTRSKPGASASWTFSSLAIGPDRRAKRLRIGMARSDNGDDFLDVGGIIQCWLSLS